VFDTADCGLQTNDMKSLSSEKGKCRLHRMSPNARILFFTADKSVYSISSPSLVIILTSPRSRFFVGAYKSFSTQLATFCDDDILRFFPGSLNNLCLHLTAGRLVGCQLIVS
jgi:hypothetical protein